MSEKPTVMPAVALHVCPCCGAHSLGESRYCAVDGTELRPARETDPLLGRRVGAYMLRRVLAAGGMGHVYLAERADDARRCVVKVLDPEVSRNEEARTRFAREATNQSRLRGHPHVCELHEFGVTDEGLTYIAMEHVAGESLRALLHRTPDLPPSRVAELVRQAAAGLAAAHGIGLVHRDLKPENIMVGTDAAGADHVTLIDFGIAKDPADREQRVTNSGVRIGTPLFMSPEQLAADAVGPAADQYALGLVTFLMLTGTLPFDTTAAEAIHRRLTGRLLTLRDVRPEVRWPAAVQAALDRALALAPHERYPSTEQFAQALGKAIAAWGAAPACADLRPTTADTGEYASPLGARQRGGERPLGPPGLLARWRGAWSRLTESGGAPPPQG